MDSPAGSPHRPALRAAVPVLRRGPATVQVGLDDAALIFTGSSPGLLRLLERLDGAHTVADLHEAATDEGLAGADVDWALLRLNTAGLLNGSSHHANDTYERSKLRLLGAGALGRELAGLLARAGVGTIYLVDNGVPDPALYPHSGVLGRQSDALRSQLALTRSRVVVVNDWSKPERVRVDLTIVATDFAEPDRTALDGLVRSDQPHLVLRRLGDQAVVGPLVLPGTTPCVRCSDLTRTDADSAWPQLLRQLSRTTLPTSEVLTRWAAATGAAQVLAFLTGGSAETRGVTLELSGLDFGLRWRTWPRHLSCGCHWTAERTG